MTCAPRAAATTPRSWTCLLYTSSIEADGYVITDAHERGDATYTLQQIMDQSSNIGISLATENATVGDVSGFRNLYNKINEYNLHTKTGVDYPGEGEAGTDYLGALLPFDEWSKVTGYNVSFGQGLSLTPLQITRFYGALVVVLVAGLLVLGMVCAERFPVRSWPSRIRSVVRNSQEVRLEEQDVEVEVVPQEDVYKRQMQRVRQTGRGCFT